MPGEDKPKNIGAIWKRKTKNGDTYLTGQIMVNGEQISFISFLNKFKKDDKHPDFQIYPSQQRGEAKPQQQAQPKPEAQEEEEF